MMAFLLFFNYQNVRLFKQAESNFLQGDDNSLLLAETQLLEVVQKDSDNESAFIMLGEIARKRKIYPEQVYYCYMACRLNPLSRENKERYINSLCFARYFDRLESFLSQEAPLNDQHRMLLLYAAGRNGNFNKYKEQMPKVKNSGNTKSLISLLFEQKQLPPGKKLAAAGKLNFDKDPFWQQELFVAQTDLFLELGNINAAEKCMLEAYKLNEYAFAPALGRFYAGYRNFGKALEVFEKHLSVYHDQSVAMQCAEIYCLLNQVEKIEALQKEYQADPGSRAMVCDYYLECLIAFARKDFTALKDLTEPLRKSVSSPLASFIFFCVDIQQGELREVQASYNMLLKHKEHQSLQEQADKILLDYLKNAFAKGKELEKTAALAAKLYERRKDAFIAKLILLAQKRAGSVDVLMLKDAVRRFGNDRGVMKLAIEYYLSSEILEAEKLIAVYKQKFSSRANETLGYEIVLNMRKRDLDKVSELFRKNLSAEILPQYWNFVRSTKRKSDLLFLSSDKLYGPYARALLLMSSGKNKQAAAILENVEAKNDPELLFFAAKILAENGYHKAALEKYRQIPDSSSLKLTVLLNMAEIYAELGDIDESLKFAKRAYIQAPQMPETQLYYGDKLYKKGEISLISDIIKLSSRTPQRRQMESLWIIGMQQRIKECSMNTQKEKIRELCRQVLVIAPDNHIALEYLRQMPQ
jgi:hypothetical protein